MDIVRNSRSQYAPLNAATIDATAEEWFAINLDKEASVKHRSEFEAWLREPEHAAAYWRVHQIWNTIGRYVGTSRLDELTQRALEDTREVGRRPVDWRVAGIAIAALLCGLWVGHKLLGASPPRGPKERGAQLASFDYTGTRPLPLATSRVQWGTRDPSMSDWR